MQDRINSLKILTAVIMGIEVLVLVVLNLVLDISLEFLVYVYLIIDICLLLYAFYIFEVGIKDREFDISRVLGRDGKSALNYGRVGIIVYDENYEVSWISESLKDSPLDIVGEKITRAVDGIQPLFTESLPKVTIEVGESKYEAVRSDEDRAIFVKDVTELVDITRSYNDERLVMGLIYFDNYNETTQHEDESTIAAINTQIRQKAIDWAANNHAVIRKVRNDRFFIVCNNVNFKKMIASKFSILEEVKKASKKLDVNITVSMTFATGFSDLVEMDTTINSLMETVLARGGDQVAVKEAGKDVVYYGNSSASSGKTSKVRARVIAESLDGIIRDSSKIFIIPHATADMDAFGSALGMDDIIKTYKKKSYVIFNGITIEETAKAVYQQNLEALNQHHNFISEGQALEALDDSSLVVIVDHHSIDLTSAAELVNKAKRVVVIDHHRRKNEAIVESLLIYNEPAASSVVELVTELAQYQSEEVFIPEIDASIMYAGILVDTGNFHSRSSARTFEACASLRRHGADVDLTNEWLKESLDSFTSKNKISRYMEVIDHNIAICAVTENTIFSRTTLSQVGDQLCTVKDIEAVFIIGKIDEENVAVSARSNGQVNVQLILEKMGGGGHFNAAGFHRSNVSVCDLKMELLTAVQEYFGGSESNESNSVS